MNEIDFPLTRTELLARGYLVDVTPVAKVVGITIPIDVSFTLFDHYLANPAADVDPFTNVRNTLTALRDRVLHEDPDGDLHFTMIYPMGGKLVTVALVAVLSQHDDGQIGTVYLAGDLADED